MANLVGPRSRRMVVAMKLEANYGVDVFAGTYTGPDIIPAFAIQPSVPTVEIENLAQGGQLGHLPSIIGLPSAMVTFSVNLRGRGAAYAAGTRPEADVAFRGCGLSSTVDATGGSEKVTYIPVDPASHESVTIYVVQENGTTLKIAGAFGNVQIDQKAAGGAVAKFSFAGQLAGIVDVTYVAGAISGTPQPPVMKSAAFQIGTENYAPRFSQIGINLGNTVSPVPSANGASGVAGYMIADRRVVLTMDPEIVALATYPWFTKWNAGTLSDITFQVGTVQYNRMKYSFGQTQMTQQGYGTRDNLTSLPSTILAVLAAGNDDFSLIFD